MWFFFLERERERTCFIWQKTGVFSCKLFEDSKEKEKLGFLAEKFVKKKAKVTEDFQAFFRSNFFKNLKSNRWRKIEIPRRSIFFCNQWWYFRDISCFQCYSIVPFVSSSSEKKTCLLFWRRKTGVLSFFGGIKKTNATPYLERCFVVCFCLPLVSW